MLAGCGGFHAPTDAAPTQSSLSMAAHDRPVACPPICAAFSKSFIFVISGASNMVTGETKSFFSFAKSVSQTCGLSFPLERKNP